MAVLRIRAMTRVAWAARAGGCPRCQAAAESGLLWRSHSSASLKKEHGGRDGRDELLDGEETPVPLTLCGARREVQFLEARMQQLETENISELTMDKVNLTHLESSSGFTRKSHVESFAEEQVTKKKEDGGSVRTPLQPTRWIEKLNREKWTNHKRQQRLQNKFWRFPSSPGTNLPQEDPPQGQSLKWAEEPRRKTNLAKPVKIERWKTSHQPRVELNGASNAKAEPSNSGLDELAGEAEEEMRSSSARPLLEDKEGNKYGNTQLSILAFLETCILIGDLEKAQQCLLFYHRCPARRKHLSIKMYNSLLHGWAKKGSFPQIARLFVMLEESGLKPTLNSYAAALECMGRGATSAKVIRRCVQQLAEDGFRLEELFEDCTFQEDEREMVLKALQTLQPDFQPPVRLQATVCSSPLLRDFYSKEQSVSYQKMDFPLHNLQERFHSQLELEKADTITIDSVEAIKPLTEQQVKARELLNALRSHWRQSLLQSLRESKVRMAALTPRSLRMNLYPFLCVLDEREYVELMLQSLSNLPPKGESLLIIARELGAKIYSRCAIRRRMHYQMVDKIQTIYNSYLQLLAKDSQLDNYLPREYWEKLEAEMASGPSLTSNDSPWPHVILVQLGTHLVDLMVQGIRVQKNILSSSLEQKLIPVLYHMYSFRSNRQIGFIKPHPILTQILSDAAESSLTFDAFVMPMLCPPVPWTSPRFGAYILTPSKLMRYVEGAIQHQLLLEKCPTSQLHPVLDALNQLSNCAWKINQRVLDIIISIFNDKGNEKLDIPPPLSEAPDMPKPHLEEGQSSWDKSVLKREMAQCRKKMAEMYSLRMDALYKLSIANHMRNQVFWFPHNMDFRGRTYPCPPYFNHLGNDVTRAILLFAEGKPLGEHGLNWLKIHLINLTGLKKRSSLQQRLQYANEIIEDILDSADYPLTGRKWWMSTDEPWQALACCMEIAKALRSPDPAKYISHFPVHQDGSCNGLQHYAALGRDVIGAKSVNLMPCDIPQDVYSDVAQQVEEFRRQDAENGLVIAQVLDGFISRKVVKQTVMTVVYGVTRYGGRLQIEKRLKEMDTFPQEYVWEASHYLVQKVFSGLKEMFSGIREIQLWLTQSARMIAKSGSTVEWITPLGLPIVQPYHRSKSASFYSNLQNVSLQVTSDASEKPDTVKQKNAFPPNFIHSLDSTHMMLTALQCHRQGLTFVSVHDCFWTHALTVDIMNQVCREQFVVLHSQPLLQELSCFMLQNYCVLGTPKSRNIPENQRMMELLSKVPQTGDFDLQKVKESIFFFS
ncbi:LOW QUALITY PROTEIN: DNA-directed RNA polymerase, mitochondrial [Rhinatrema bivittatum]|uniref:LOW QUALITY PROTEIN: DNA-directed RNA polymerase, mitochondrial n=1 Tax=Rhinatrema bivittatum TaxID=194408 RepID=UPI00112A63B5|nr:LOW QUALITY PROTEIN: DNA-directed RNA polymerase, mitochondrial [Rhinatrema bivittatum]